MQLNVMQGKNRLDGSKPLFSFGRWATRGLVYPQRCSTPFDGAFRESWSHISIPPTALRKCILFNVKWNDVSPSATETKLPWDKKTQLLQDWLRVFRLAPLRPFQQKIGEKPIQINQAKLHEFHHLITTDGLTASVHLHKRSPVDTPCKRRKVEKKEESNHRLAVFPSKRNVQTKSELKAMSPEERLKGREVWGLDPGRKALYSAVSTGRFQSLDHFTKHQYNDQTQQTNISRSTKGYYKKLKQAKTPYTRDNRRQCFFTPFDGALCWSSVRLGRCPTGLKGLKESTR